MLGFLFRFKLRKPAGRAVASRWSKRETSEPRRALVKQGSNPAHHRQLERVKREQDSANTFEAVAREWVALKTWEPITKKRRLDMPDRERPPRRVPCPTPGEIAQAAGRWEPNNGDGNVRAYISRRHFPREHSVLPRDRCFAASLELHPTGWQGGIA